MIDELINLAKLRNGFLLGTPQRGNEATSLSRFFVAKDGRRAVVRARERGGLRRRQVFPKFPAV